MFFAELGGVFPQFPFIAHSCCWTAEDMENNVVFVKEIMRAGRKTPGNRT